MAAFSPSLSSFQPDTCSPVIPFALRKSQRSHLALMAAAAVGTFSTRFQGAGPGVAAGVPAVLQDREMQQSSQGTSEAGTAVLTPKSHTNTLPSTSSRGTQHKLNAQPPSDGIAGCAYHIWMSGLLVPAPFSLRRERMDLQK